MKNNTTFKQREEMRSTLKMKKCRYCGTKENLTIDHKQPLILGGTNDRKNLQCLCERCNKMKSGIPHGQLVRLIEWWLDIKGFEHKHRKPIK